MSVMETALADRPQPSKMYRWLVLIFVSLAMFGNYYVYDALSPVADLLVKQLHFTDANIGLLQAALQLPQHLHGGDRRHHHRPHRRAARHPDFRHPLLCGLGHHAC